MLFVVVRTWSFGFNVVITLQNGPTYKSGDRHPDFNIWSGTIIYIRLFCAENTFCHSTRLRPLSAGKTPLWVPTVAICQSFLITNDDTARVRTKSVFSSGRIFDQRFLTARKQAQYRAPAGRWMFDSRRVRYRTLTSVVPWKTPRLENGRREKMCVFVSAHHDQRKSEKQKFSKMSLNITQNGIKKIVSKIFFFFFLNVQKRRNSLSPNMILFFSMNFSVGVCSENVFATSGAPPSHPY